MRHRTISEHNDLMWSNLVDYERVRFAARFLTQHQGTWAENPVVQRALEVLGDEAFWATIHTGHGGHFSAVRHEMLAAERSGDRDAAVALSALEMALRTAYNLIWRPGMFPPFDANSRDEILPSLRKFAESLELGDELEETLRRPFPA